MKKRVLILLCLVLAIGLTPMMAMGADKVEKADKNNDTVTLFASLGSQGFMFDDVSSDDYFFNPVLWSASNGITSGTDPIHFSPNLVCNRAQMVTFLWRAAGSAKVLDDLTFNDVDNNAYYADAVRWAIYEGITNGTSKTTFSPDDPITREQLATFIYRYAMLEADNNYSSNKYTITKYTDLYRISDWGFDGMEWCVSLGIINGVDATTLAPQKTATRAEIVTMLFRFYNR